MSHQPVLLICMGVSGSGKSTVARYLASEFDLKVLEADDFHSAGNKSLMAVGVPLTDEQREPWINSICVELSAQRKSARDCSLAYSGLRRQHRQRFREIGFNTLFLHLNSDMDTIAGRMAERAGHFMPADLLASQMEAMQSTHGEVDVVAVDNTNSLALTLARARLVAGTFLEQVNVQKS